MKRAIIILIVCGLAFLGTRQIMQFFSENVSGVGFKASPGVDRAQNIQTIQPQPVVTSLPPLTNLTFRQERRATQIAKQPEPQLQTNQMQSASPAPPKKSGKPPRQDPVARVALSLVGVDAAAEEYWALAINDSSLSEGEREDLIEDLNEEGFEDPKNPTVDELPLIINRLEIIEQYAPFAMDDVNARSFAEAYKDLVNMYVRLTGQEPP